MTSQFYSSQPCRTKMSKKLFVFSEQLWRNYQTILSHLRIQKYGEILWIPIVFIIIPRKKGQQICLAVFFVCCVIPRFLFPQATILPKCICEGHVMFVYRSCLSPFSFWVSLQRLVKVLGLRSRFWHEKFSELLYFANSSLQLTELHPRPRKRGLR